MITTCGGDISRREDRTIEAGLQAGSRHMSVKTASLATEHNVETVCPLDCPDSCSLDVTVQEGRVIGIDGSYLNPVTNGYICAKVRRFAERLYGPDRLLHPAVRKGPKGLASFE